MPPVVVAGLVQLVTQRPLAGRGGGRVVVGMPRGPGGGGVVVVVRGGGGGKGVVVCGGNMGGVVVVRGGNVGGVVGVRGGNVDGVVGVRGGDRGGALGVVPRGGGGGSVVVPVRVELGGIACASLRLPASEVQVTVFFHGKRTPVLVTLTVVCFRSRAP